MKPPKISLVSMDGKVLQVQLAAAVKVEEILALFAEIRHLADRHSVKNILIDARAFRREVSPPQRLQVALALVDNFLGCKVAGVISTDSFDPRLLAETMARNRGGNVKMTTSHQEALAWLGVTPPRAKPPVRDVGGIPAR